MTNPFTAYEFPATDAPTDRTMPDRLASIKNVRDFGAVGDGVTDDLDAIMAAFNWGQVTLVTTDTNLGNVLTFESVPDNVAVGMYATNVTDPDTMVYPQVQGKTATTVTFNNIVGVVEEGDTITFHHPVKGVIYFPPGDYYVSGPIDISPIVTQAYFLGSMGASRITGDFDDYIIKRYLFGSFAGGGSFFEKLTLVNRGALGGGIRAGTSVGIHIFDCDVTANFGITTDNNDQFGTPTDPGAYWYSLEVTMSNCHFRAYDALATGSTGLARGANGETRNCTFKDFDTAIRTYGGQGAMIYRGCYFEHNNIGISNSSGPYPASPGATGGTGLVVAGCHFKNNGIAIAYPSGNSRYAGIFIEATEGSIPGDPQYGLYPVAGGSCAFEGISITGQYEQSGVYMASGGSPCWFAAVSVDNTSTLGGVDWELPTTAMSMTLEECNVASVWTMAGLPAKTYTVGSASWSAGTATVTLTGAGDLPTAQLGNVSITGVTPSGYNGVFEHVSVPNFFTITFPLADPGGPGTVFGTGFFTVVSDAGRPNTFEGYQFNVSNADTATWGAAAVSTGSNHVNLRYTPTGWTVVGK